MSRPKLLDLFCGAGGAAVGYHRAGFEVVGVDLRPQPRYPFQFIQADALTVDLAGYDAIHASPPCQGYSRMRHLPWLRGKNYPLLIEPIRERLVATGVPWVIENVEDAPMPSSIVLCGWSMGYRFYRHRRFGSSHLLFEPPHLRHEKVIASGPASLSRRYARAAGVTGVIGTPPGHCVGSASRTAREALGIDWMRRDELTQAIPPAYTEWIGRQLITAVEESA